MSWEKELTTKQQQPEQEIGMHVCERATDTSSDFFAERLGKPLTNPGTLGGPRRGRRGPDQVLRLRTSTLRQVCQHRRPGYCPWTGPSLVATNSPCSDSFSLADSAREVIEFALYVVVWVGGERPATDWHLRFEHCVLCHQLLVQ